MVLVAPASRVPAVVNFDLEALAAFFSAGTLTVGGRSAASRHNLSSKRDALHQFSFADRCLREVNSRRLPVAARRTRKAAGLEPE
jgi:hypothetical protein